MEEPLSSGRIWPVWVRLGHDDGTEEEERMHSSASPLAAGNILAGPALLSVHSRTFLVGYCAKDRGTTSTTREMSANDPAFGWVEEGLHKDRTHVNFGHVRRIDCIDRGSHPLLKPLWGNDHHASSYSRLIILLSHHIPRVHLQRIQQAVQYTLDSTVSSGNAWGRAYADKNNCPVSRQWQWHGNGMFEPMYSVYSVPFLRRAPYLCPALPLYGYGTGASYSRSVASRPSSAPSISVRRCCIQCVDNLQRSSAEGPPFQTVRRRRGSRTRISDPSPRLDPDPLRRSICVPSVCAATTPTNEISDDFGPGSGSGGVAVVPPTTLD
ncbi:hypothetical protein M430DRAFT_55321 [Amorphotheca resinae ATCC 22711]|uniref:Uncharacterized protein n=1 Tax=Amorphotheca resinae ATCC 22711 TaxID=857342 RepID=A0A2T3BES8_AMORE|nr:hypothetical protein M430DRAFT_55321 [Amorphotheca resinae ATCC 22711]PSS27885.1 hypothetical protein M430DRAFT_55321 [Amorphotheca resinae ATCC 22711]